MPQPPRSAFAALFVLVASLCQLPYSSVATADDDPPVEKPAADAEKPLERLIYVPYRDLKKALGSIDRTVFLPYGEYLELVRRAEAMRGQAERPRAVLSSSRYVARVADDHVRITATFEIEALDGPWVEAPVDFSGATVGKVSTPNGRPEVLLRGMGNGRYAFVLPTKGAHEVQLELLAKVRRSPDGRGFDIGVPSAGISTLELVVPEADQVVRVEPDAVVLPAAARDAADAKGPPAAAADGAAVDGVADDGVADDAAAPEDVDEEATRVRVDLGSNTRISARWSPKAGIEPDMDLLASVDGQLQVTLSDRLVRQRAVLAYRVLRGEQTKVRVAVPKGHRVLDVVSPNVELRPFSTEDDEKRTVVTAELLAPTREPFTLEILTEGPLPDEAFRVAGLEDDGTAHGIHALDVVRESGFLAVVPERETTLSVDSSSGVVRVEGSDVPKPLVAARGSYFRYFDADFELVVSVEPIEPRLVVVTDAMIEILDDRIATQTNFATRIERVGVFELAYRIPEGVEIVDVVCDRMRERTFDEATRTLRVALRERTQGDVAVEIRTRAAFDGSQDVDELKLGVPVPVGVEQETGRTVLRAVGGVAVRVNEAATTGLTPDPTAARAGREATDLVGAWGFTRRPFEIVVSTLPRPTRLSARIGTDIAVQRDVARVRSRIDFLVEYAGVDEFRLAVPEAVIDGLTVKQRAYVPSEWSGGVEVEAAEEPVDWKPEPAENGWIPIRVRLSRKVTGHQVLIVEYDLAPGIAAAPIVAPADAAPEAEAEAEDAADADAADAADPADADEGGDAAQPADAEAGDDPVPDPQPLEEPAEGELFVLQPPRVLGGGGGLELAELRGEVTVTKERMLTITGRVRGGDSEGIDVRELEFQTVPDAFLAFRYVEQPVTVEVVSVVHEIKEVLRTVVSRALVEVVVGKDEFATYRCRYVIVSSERQTLPLQLPLNAHVHGIRLEERDGTLRDLELQRDDAAKPAEGFEAFTLDVARSTASDVPFRLSVVFHWPLEPQPFATRGGRLKLNLPGIGGASAGTQQLRTVVWVPEGYAVVGTPDEFVAESELVFGRQGWFGPLRPVSNRLDGDEWIGGQTPSGVYELATVGQPFVYTSVGGPEAITLQWWDLPFVAWVVGATIAIIGLLLRNTSLRNKLTVLVVVAAALGAYALKDPDSALLLLHSARYGLLVLLVAWILAEVAAVLHSARALFTNGDGAGVPAMAGPSAGPAPPAEPPTPSIPAPPPPESDSNPPAG